MKAKWDRGCQKADSLDCSELQITPSSPSSSTRVGLGIRTVSNGDAEPPARAVTVDENMRTVAAKKQQQGNAESNCTFQYSGVFPKGQGMKD